MKNIIFFNSNFDKNKVKSLILWSRRNCDEYVTIELLEKLKELGFKYATQAGISLGLDDLKIPSSKSDFILQSDKYIQFTHIQYKQGYVNSIEKFQQLIDTWHRTSEILKQHVIQNFRSTNTLNPVYMMAFSGARGNVSQVRQLVGMRGLMSDPQGTILDFPIKSNFREGLTLTEYVISCYGARKGLVDTALKTANSGYLTRRLVDVSHHIVISEFDCKTLSRIALSSIKENNKIIVALQNRIIGRVLAENVYAYLNIENKKLYKKFTLKKIKLKSTHINNLRFKNNITEEISNWTPSTTIITPVLNKENRFSTKKFYLNVTLKNARLLALFFQLVVAHFENKFTEQNKIFQADTEKLVDIYGLHIKQKLLDFHPWWYGSYINISKTNKTTVTVKKYFDLNYTFSKLQQFTVDLNSKFSILSLFVFHAIFYCTQKTLIATKNSEISVRKAKILGNFKTRIFVRSPLTCETYQSLCQLCYGWSLAHGKLVSVGEAVGIIAGQSIGEPGTQLTMRTFHTGGVFSGEMINEIRAPFDGVVYFYEPLPGKRVRTPHGKIAFLTRKKGSFQIHSAFDSFASPALQGKADKGQDEGKQIQVAKFEPVTFEVPCSTMLFIHNHEHVNKTQLLAEFSYLNEQENTSVKANHYVYSELSGELLYNDVLLHKIFWNNKQYPVFIPKNNLGELIILSGTRFYQPDVFPFFIQPGDIINENSVMSQYYGVLNDKNLVNENVVQKQVFMSSAMPFGREQHDRVASRPIHFENQQNLFSHQNPFKALHQNETKVEKTSFHTKKIRKINLIDTNHVFLNRLYIYLPISSIQYKKIGYFIFFKNTMSALQINGCISAASLQHKYEYKNIDVLKKTWRFQAFPKKYKTYTDGILVSNNFYHNEIYHTGESFFISENIFDFLSNNIFITDKTTNKVINFLLKKHYSVKKFISSNLVMWHPNFQGKIVGLNFKLSGLSEISHPCIKEKLVKIKLVSYKPCILTFPSGFKLYKNRIINTKVLKKSFKVKSHYRLPILNPQFPFSAAKPTFSSLFDSDLSLFKINFENKKNEQTKFSTQDSVVSFFNKKSTFKQSLLTKTKKFKFFKKATFQQTQKNQTNLTIKKGWLFYPVHFQNNLHKHKSISISGLQSIESITFDQCHVYLEFVSATKFLKNKHVNKKIQTINLSNNSKSSQIVSLHNILNSEKIYDEFSLTKLFPAKQCDFRKKNYKSCIYLYNVHFISCFARVDRNSSSDLQQKDQHKKPYKICNYSDLFFKNFSNISELQTKICVLTKLIEKYNFPNFVTLNKQNLYEFKKFYFLENFNFNLSSIKITNLLLFKTYLCSGKFNLFYFSYNSNQFYTKFLSKNIIVPTNSWKSTQQKQKFIILARKIYPYSFFKALDYKNSLCEKNHYQTNICNFLKINKYTQVNNVKNFTKLAKFNKQISTELYSSFPTPEFYLKPYFFYRYQKQIYVPVNQFIFTYLIRFAISKHYILNCDSCIQIQINLNPTKSDIDIRESELSIHSSFFKFTNKSFFLNKTKLQKLKTIYLVYLLKHTLSFSSHFALQVFFKRKIKLANFAKYSFEKYDTKILTSKEKYFSNETPISLIRFFSLNKGEIVSTTSKNRQHSDYLILTKKDEISFSTYSSNNQSNKISQKISQKRCYLGNFLQYGTILQTKVAISEPGQIIKIEKFKITLRKTQPMLCSSLANIAVNDGEIIEKNQLIFKLKYQQLKTGDIVQGIPKIEQIFEARQINQGGLHGANLHIQLENYFKCFSRYFNPQQAAKLTVRIIQQIIVRGVQKVYQSQGVSIADKHLEIVVRQMTSKVKIIRSGNSYFLPGEIIDLDIVEGINYNLQEFQHIFTQNHENIDKEKHKRKVIQKQHKKEYKKLEYKPVIIGITKKSLNTNSFISEASFQETTRVLTNAAVQAKTDFLKGLKENVILGHIISAGTGFHDISSSEKESFDIFKKKYHQTNDNTIF